MYARRAARSISAVALAGGLSAGLGLTAPTASAMPAPQDTRVSVGSLCQQAVHGLEFHEGVPSTQDGLPGLRCGQTFGAAKSLGLSGDKPREHELTTTTDDDYAEESEESEYEADDSYEHEADDSYAHEEESEYDVEDSESDDESDEEKYEDDAEGDESEESEDDDYEDVDDDGHEHGEDHESDD